MNRIPVQWRMRRIVAVLAGLFSAGVALGQFPFSQLPKDADTNEFTMRVKVVDAVSGQPLPGAAVMVPMGMPTHDRPSTNEWLFPADGQGVAVVRAPAAAVAFNYFVLSVSNAGYSLKNISWQSPQQNRERVDAVRRIVPAEHTVRMERWQTIGGFVKDERGQPIEGIRIVASGTGAAAYSYADDGAAREYSALNREEKNAAVSDARGFWRYDQFPRDMVRFSIDAIRPDRSQMRFVTPSHDARFPTEPGELVEMAALLATNAVLQLKEGVTIRGVVVDEAGKPIAGALVMERSGDSLGNQILVTTNDARGRFELPHRTGMQYLLTASAAGYSIQSTGVTVSAESPELKIVLSIAQPLRLRLVDEKGEPVAGAMVSAPEYRNRGHLQEWHDKSDAGGRVVWTNAPRQILSIAVATTNGQIQMARVEPGTAEHVVKVWREPRTTASVQVRAVDVETGQPLVEFGVWKDIPPGGVAKEANWQTTNGLVKGELAKADFQEGWNSGYRIEVRAKGYRAWRSASLEFDEGDVVLTASLKRGRAPSGVVQLPGGEPAEDARVFSVPSTESIFLYSPQNFFDDINLRNGMTRTKTGRDGKFTLESAAEGLRLIVIHRSGFASLAVDELGEQGVVKLAPYATVAGTVRFAGRPVARERLSLRAPVVWEGADGYQVSLSSVTDANGRFTFTNVPPGDYLLYRNRIFVSGQTVEESHRMVISVKPGQLNEIDYTFNGRAIIGQVDADGEVAWENDHHMLVAKLPPPPPGPTFSAYTDPETFQKARRVHGKSKAVLDYERKRQQFELLFDKDGAFRIDDVPPGKYELRIAVTKPLPANARNRYERSQEVIGSIKREIVVPPGPSGTPVDLGVIPMEVKESPGVNTLPMDFTADQLDGKPFHLAGLRGRPVVVCFWGKWAPGSEKKLVDLRAAAAAMGAAEKPALVTVNLDSNIADARDGVKELGAGWTHTQLSGPEMFMVTERWKVDALPAVILLDAEGRVKGRDFDGKRLASSVKRLMAAKK